MYTALADGLLSRYMGVGGTVVSACSIAQAYNFFPTPRPCHSGHVDNGARYQCGSLTSSFLVSSS
jgi:hypothetical protein